MQAIEEHLPVFRRHFDRLVIPYSSDRACVIIEPREHEHLELAIKNVMYFVSERTESSESSDSSDLPDDALRHSSKTLAQSVARRKRGGGKKKILGAHDEKQKDFSLGTSESSSKESHVAAPDGTPDKSYDSPDKSAQTNWALYIFHSKENEQFVIDMIGEAHLSQVHLVCVSEQNLTIRDYCFLLVSEMFWNRIDAEWVLIFQTDSYLRRHGIDEFVSEDYAMIGAPWRDWHQASPRQAGNGGLSLRKKSAILEAIRWSDRNVPYQAGWNEDVFYHTVLERMMMSRQTTSGDVIKLATKERAKHFSVETLYYANPLGVHKYWNYLPDPEGHLSTLQL